MLRRKLKVDLAADCREGGEFFLSSTLYTSAHIYFLIKIVYWSVGEKKRKKNSSYKTMRNAHLLIAC